MDIILKDTDLGVKFLLSSLFNDYVPLQTENLHSINDRGCYGRLSVLTTMRLGVQWHLLPSGTRYLIKQNPQDQGTSRTGSGGFFFLFPSFSLSLPFFPFPSPEILSCLPYQTDILTSCHKWHLICTNFKTNKSTCQSGNFKKELSPAGIV